MRKPRVVAGGFTVLIFLAMSFATTSVEGQAGQGTWKVPRTPWGEPDFQGIWTTNEMHGVPNTRAKGIPAEITEAAALSRRQQTTAGTLTGETVGNYDEAFRDTSAKFTKQSISRQGSLVIDPADGQMPPLTAKELERRKASGAEVGGGADVIGRGRPADWIAFGPWGRCITRGAQTIVPPSGYNNGVQIVQAPGVVAIQKEMIHETRVVNVNGVAPGAKLRTWAGNSRSRWEGDTLVVEITNFDGRAGLSGGTKDAKLTERFTRLGPNELEYLYTVDDPNIWTTPWTGRMTMSLDPAQYELVEYACHEANYSMMNSLSAARAEEKAEREAAAKKPASR
jgi:hypothetical protein